MKYFHSEGWYPWLVVPWYPVPGLSWYGRPILFSGVGYPSPNAGGQADPFGTVNGDEKCPVAGGTSWWSGYPVVGGAPWWSG